MKTFGTGRLRGSAAAFLVLLLTALTGTGLYGSAFAEPAEGAAAGGQGRTMLLLDSSGSMAEGAGGGKTKIEAAKSALRTVVKGLPADAEVGLRVFGAKVFSRTDAGSCEDSQVVVEPGADNRDDLLGQIDKYKPYGETPIPHALREAAKDLGSEGVRSIVLVSDGESTCDPDPCKVAEDLAEDGIDLRIDVVGLSVSGKARDQLKCIAESGNGDYFDADDAGDIEATLTRVAKRAAQPFTLGGEPITGGTESAPTPITVGSWVDTISAGVDEYYAFERKEAGSTLRVSAVTQGANRSNDPISVEILDPEGRRCDLGYISRILNTRSLSGAQATAGEAEECDRPGRYTFKVSRGVRDTEPAPVGLQVTEEPPSSDPGFVGADVDADEITVRELSFEGTAKPVAGSASFEAAPELTTGLWSSDVVPGEALVYRFRLEYGQSATVGLRFPVATAAQDEAFGTNAPLARFTLRNPLLANVGFPRDAVYSGRVAGREAATFSTATPQVSKVTGQGGGKFDGGGDYTAAGDYYLMIALERNDETLEIPFQIDLRIEGEPAEGPTYADGVSWSITDGLGESAGEELTAPAPDESDDTRKTAAGEDDSSNLRKGLGGAAAVLGIGALGLSALLLRRRRNAA
ncbi:vWA domain-containing protein [Nocardioides gilvus]|uniref:vWA domain-containing protein n=1 Tax=Nocardioides gilvus TaxID=1735589 RepID=UPI000D74CA5B|nr:VWA domain-containing protein [Nocardioides gilvus]